jgi:hypothetical protein
MGWCHYYSIDSKEPSIENSSAIIVKAYAICSNFDVCNNIFVLSCDCTYH